MKEKMKLMLDYLKWMNYDLDEFYVISIYKDKIHLQGESKDGSLQKKYAAKGFVFVKEDGFFDRAVSKDKKIEILIHP